MATELLSFARVGALPASLPRQLTHFVGRDLELAEIRRILGSSRLVTLTGPGGSGKTRLALEAARRWAESFPDGVAWVDLAPLSDPSLLARHVGSTLGLGEDLERSPSEILVDRLRPLGLLLLLDNCEHLVAECARLAHGLLAACPDLRILTTSREPLGVEGETAWAVPPLSLPASADPSTAGGVAHSEAVQLFLDRAQAVQPGFVLTDSNAAAIARICRQLDGIPLAIELAAARIRVLPAEQIAERLGDVFGLLTTRSRTAPPRHRTLRDAIDWSHDLLDEPERTLLRRLAVFSSRVPLDAVESVCAGESCGPDEILDLLTALVDKSLVRAESRQGEARFSLLEPMRQYALEKLEEAGELDALRERHAAYYSSLAERAEPHIRGGTRGTEWMVRLERDHCNLRTAAEWLGEDRSRRERQLRLVTALCWFYFAQGIFREPRERLERALTDTAGLPDPVVGRAYAVLGYQAIWLGDHPAVRAPLEKGVALLRGQDEPDALCFALTGLGAAVGLSGDAPASYALFDEAHATLGGYQECRRNGFPELLLYAFTDYWRGVVAQFHGDLARARRSFESCVTVARETADHPSIAHPLAALARLHVLEGELGRARDCLAESLPIHASNDDRWGMADALEGAAQLAAAEGDPLRAAKLLGASDGLRESTGLALPHHLLADRARLLDSIRSAVGDAALEDSRSAGRGITVPDVIDEALGRTAPAVQRRRDAAPGELGAPVAVPPASRHVSAPATADLEVLALGPLQVFRGGEELAAGAWGSAKPKEMLLFLLCHPAGASRDQVGLALWPDATSQRVGNSFHVTLHRLRKALGQGEWIARMGDRYVVSPEITYRFDAAVFEDDVGAALAEMRRGGPAADRLEAALGLWRGPFLEEEVVGDWHLEVRDRLQRVYLDGLLALGRHHADAGMHAPAAAAYQRAIAADDLHEEAYRKLMLSLARSGDRSQALRLYQRLSALLEREVGARPEHETEALYTRLRLGETP